jgi:hypothetical protein
MCVAAEVGADWALADLTLRELVGAIDRALRAGVTPLTIRKATALVLNGGDAEAAAALAGTPDIRSRLDAMPMRAA